MTTINILIYTDHNRINYWSDKFLGDITIENMTNRNFKVIKQSNSQIIQSEMFQIEIYSYLNENQKGKIIDTIILDRPITKEQELVLYSLKGHRNSIIKTENYNREDSNN